MQGTEGRVERDPGGAGETAPAGAPRRARPVPERGRWPRRQDASPDLCILCVTGKPAAGPTIDQRKSILMSAVHAPRSTTWLVLVLGLMMLVAPSCAHAPGGGPAVVPGLIVRVDQTPGPDTVVYQRTITRAGRDTSAGTRTVVLQVRHGPGGAPLLEVEQRFPGGGGEIVDTAVADLGTLRAVAHQSHQPTRTMRFAFVGNAAEGTVAPPAAGDSAAKVEAVHQALGGPIFDSNVLDLVVSGLPLRPGFSTVLPFFIYERGGRVSMPVEVRERVTTAFSRLGQREAWVVAVGVPGAPATVWVDTGTRAVLRVRYDISARGISFTDERVTSLRR